MSRKNHSSEAETQVNERTYQWSGEMEAAHAAEPWKTAYDIERDFAPMDPNSPYFSSPNLDAEPVPEPEISTSVIEASNANQPSDETIQRMSNEFNNVLAFVSRCPGVDYEPGQFGTCEFTTEQVIMVCYRIDFGESDKDISRRLGRLVRKGILTKVKRGIYKASYLLTMPHDEFIKAIDSNRSKRNNRPT